VFLTFWLFTFVNIFIEMGQNENWWRRNYMSECIYSVYIYIYIYIYDTPHLCIRIVISRTKHIHKCINLLSLNNTIHINIYRYVLYHSKYCSSTVMSYTCTISYSYYAVYCCFVTCFFPCFGYPWWWLSWVERYIM
jgi:hypothetical protein